MDGEPTNGCTGTHTDGQGPGEMGELIDAPAGEEKLKGMRPTAGASAAGWWI